MGAAERSHIEATAAKLRAERKVSEAVAAANDVAEQPLDDVERFIARFCSFRLEHERVAVTLWAAHAHMVNEFHTTPRLLLSSPEAGSGKTRVLEVLDLLVPNSMFSLSASPAAIFRTLATKQVTLLVDEVDTVFNKRGSEDSNEDLRAMFNAGYKRGASIPRCVGPRHDVQRFAVFAATAFAGLGDLPETIMSRSIIVRMRKRAPGEIVEAFRTREHEPQGQELRDRLGAWAANVAKDCGAAWPPMPEGIVDRPAEVWEPLLAVADAACGAWPQRARAACVALAAVAADRRASLGVRLLADLRLIFGDADALHTETILDRLQHGTDARGERVLDEDAPWAELHGKPLGERGLASMLKKYDVKSVKVKAAGRALQGYRREHLWDAWQRYLPPPAGKAEPAEPAEPSQGEASSAGSGSAERFRNLECQVEPSGRDFPREVPLVPEVPDFAGGESACDGEAPGAEPAAAADEF